MSQEGGKKRKKSSKGLTFAEQQLKKHGWEKGKGLGKQENGISEAIKVKVKSDTAGVGHHPGEQFTFHWWDHLFNASAANLAVQAGKDGVRVKSSSEQAGKITNKKPRKAHESKDMLYGRFVKAATLTSGGEEPLRPVPSSDSSSSSDEEKLDLSTARRLTDEELVQACGGRTAHKGARHGLTMNAKLARLEEQERAFLAARLHRPKATPGGEETPALADGGRSRERKKSEKEPVEPLGYETPEGTELEEKRRRKKKKRRKRRKTQEEEGGSEIEAAEGGQRSSEVADRKRKAKRKVE